MYKRTLQTGTFPMILGSFNVLDPNHSILFSRSDLDCLGSSWVSFHLLTLTEHLPLTLLVQKSPKLPRHLGNNIQVSRAFKAAGDTLLGPVAVETAARTVNIGIMLMDALTLVL